MPPSRINPAPNSAMWHGDQNSLLKQAWRRNDAERRRPTSPTLDRRERPHPNRFPRSKQGQAAVADLPLSIVTWASVDEVERDLEARAVQVVLGAQLERHAPIRARVGRILFQIDITRIARIQAARARTFAVRRGQRGGRPERIVERAVPDALELVVG